MTKKLEIALACLISLSLIACSKVDSTFADSSIETTSVPQTTASITSETTTASSSETTVTAAPVTTTVTTTSTTTKPSMQSLIIFYFDTSDNYVLMQKSIEVPNNQDLKMKLQTIANEVSVCNFNGYGIEVSKIDNNIAYINLIDDPNTSYDTGWLQQFQGTGKAIDTAMILFENFFQKQLSCKWIDAVQLLHNGEIMEEFDEFNDVGIVYKADSDIYWSWHNQDQMNTVTSGVM